MTELPLSSPRRQGIDRVAIVGVGAVGSTTAYAMLQAGAAKEILLVDLDKRRVEGEMMDLQHSVPFAHHVNIEVRSAEELEGCDLIIVTAGAGQKPGETRMDLLKRNVEIFDSFFPTISKNNPSALYLIITNPVDVMTRVALKQTGLPPEQVFGSGTVLDTARFKTLLAARCGVTARNVTAYVMGEHGDSEVLVWSRVMVGPFRLREFLDAHQVTFTEEDRQAIDLEVRRAAYEIIERKGATHFAIGVGAVRLAQALTHKQYGMFTVSRRFCGKYGLNDVCLSAPTLVNRHGAMEHLELKLADDELKALLRSAELLSEAYDGLKL